MLFNKFNKLLKIVKDPFYTKALFKGVAAGTEHLDVLNQYSFSHIVDIGANRGQFALVSRKLFPNAKITSYEPLDEPAAVFNSVFENDRNVTLHRCAIGSEESNAVIHVSESDDSSSLLPISGNQTRLFPQTAESETRETKVLPLHKTLDLTGLNGETLLKIDVQGYELEVLKGCQLDLVRFSNVYVECSFIELYEGQVFADEVINFLQKNNFALVGVYNVHYDKFGKAIQADFLFARN